VRPRLSQIPRASLILTFALATDGSLRRLSREARGTFVRLAVRWPQRQVLWDPVGSVLCWSEPVTAGKRRAALLGLALGIVATLALEAPCAVLLAAITFFVGRAVRLPLELSFEQVLLGCALVRSFANLHAACQAWRAERVPDGWTLDLVGAFPSGAGRGDSLLDKFLHIADMAGATVRVKCPAERVGFYERHGFENTGRSGAPLRELVRTRKRPTTQLIG